MTSKVSVRKYDRRYGWAFPEVRTTKECVLAVGLGREVTLSMMKAELQALGFTDYCYGWAINHFDSHTGDETDLKLVREVGEKLDVRVVVEPEESI
jgi:hypothetical protein